MQVFGTQELIHLFNSNLRNMQTQVLSESKNQLLNCNEVEYIPYLVSIYKIELVEFDWEKKYITDQEESIPINDYGRQRTVTRQAITYHIPYKGNRDLLSFRTSDRVMWPVEIEINTFTSEILFSIINLKDDSEEIKREADITIENIRQHAANVTKEIKQYNNNLESQITAAVKSRKADLLKQSNLLASLGIPIKKSPNAPDTFVIPTLRKKAIIKKPTAPDTSFKPEPTLDSSTYREILKICHDTGIEIERHPGIYNGKDEETLRDHFLMVLSPHFHSATGETFNKNGKTDILIRHEGTNVFIAECKFWKGIRSYHKTIDQLLSYLTWRDSKAAILCFIKNKELTPVLEQIETDTPNHPCFLKNCGKTTDSQFRFNFHLKDDNTRGVEIAVLCFHFPD